MQGKTVVLGVGGGIACYKIADLASKLTQRGANVHAVLTASALRFIQPLTFQALTHNPALSSLWEEDKSSGPSSGMPHIALADSADLVFVAPATANLLARLASGFGDDLLGATILATRAPVVLAPAMNPQMLSHPATQRNLSILRGFGYHLLEPETGRMACEHVGSGRLPETPQLLHIIEQLLFPAHDFANKTVVVTAGPTREKLDPVRYISNRSSGKMGYALAEAAARRGAHSVLISGPTHLPTPPGVERIDVTTALEMHEATLRAFSNCDILIAAAAPADFRAANLAEHKIKRGTASEMTLFLTANPDIVRECATRKRPGQIVVGFAAETQNLEKNARAKLDSKALDFIVANDVTREGAGFDVDTNSVTWLGPGESQKWPTGTKREIAERILDELASTFASKFQN